MQAVSLTIPGEFWDSQIYSGKLYLFGADHSLHVYHWARAVDSVISRYPAMQTAIRIAFLDGQILYTEPGRLLASDPAVRDVIQKQLLQLASTADLQVNFDAAAGKFLKIRDNPFPYPHADSEVYYHQMYVGLKQGLFHASTSSLEGVNINDVQKRWDSAVFSVKASHNYTTLACAAGDEGLREFGVFDAEDKPTSSEPTLVSKRMCTACDWSYQSIFGSAPGASGFLASFKKKKISDTRYQRVADRVVPSDEIFHGEGISWGCKDKIFNFKDGNLSVKTYDPRLGTSEIAGVTNPKIPEKQFLDKGTHDISGQGTLKSGDDIVSTAAAPFGSVVETHDGLQVIRSDNVFEFIEGEPVSWRVFPRSDNYGNQLHIIYEDRIEIRTYVHDYFVDQASKWAGIIR
ncbi:hypothetical protein [Burkholderia vietnamiensis]|jgi:hypothetical protein|uniref:hypothetical protein n=1 Tax=Burkholderia vietnamiensis TaxID=60552 RepID=UPI00104145EB|nr:hypothetical protein [Burkholderia vietnamiensis]